MKTVSLRNHNDKDTRFYRMMTKLFQVASIVSEQHPQKEKLLSDFLFGLLLAEYDRRSNKNNSAIINKLTQPVFNLIKDHVSSDEYQRLLVNTEVKGDEILDLKVSKSQDIRVKVPITVEKVLQHIKQKNMFALVSDEIRPVLHDLINEYANRYLSYSEGRESQPKGSQGKSARPRLKKSRFEDLFKEPDADRNAKKVIGIVDKMNLADRNNAELLYITMHGDSIRAKKNSLAYVFAALRDPENGICVIQNGVMVDQLLLFYQEFGLMVAEKKETGDVTRRNLMSVLNNPQRFSNIIYREFSSFFTKL